MIIVAINGSSKPTGNTSIALSAVTDVLESQGIETQRINIGAKAIHGCVGCRTCPKKQNRQCRFEDHPVNEWRPSLFEADGLLIGSPVYYAGINGALKCLLDRAFFIAAFSGGLFRHKVGAAVCAVRRAGFVPAVDQINKYFMMSEMFIPSGNYWNGAYGMAPGEAAKDVEGIQNLRVLGGNMAWLMKQLDAGKASLPPPEPKQQMNFIRKD